MTHAIQPVPLPAGWLHRPGTPADDLDLLVLLLNSYDPLADPPDRLDTVTWLAGALTAAGHGDVAATLTSRDVRALRRLRSRLRQAFTCTQAAQAVDILNPLLLAARAVPVLVENENGGLSLRVAPESTGYAALAARLPAALAAYIAEYGPQRLGTCAAAPCTCAFIDRTRPSKRRYCCDLCNDRAAASAYRRRRRASGGQGGT
jgi:predicted RNA-binding Zn ribbon-like protein